jgi:pilus assembly protein CpaE
MASGSDKIRILIVDDIPETRENVRKLLAFETDVEVVGVAGTGREAIQLARELQPHIIMMDINMPDMDGITAVESITRESSIAQVIMMSVQSEADYLRRSMLAGARDFLTKPFTGEDLISTIRRVHRMSQSRVAVAPAAGLAQAQPQVGRGGPVTAARPVVREGVVIVVFGPKGGIGTTTLAVNLAVAFQQRGPDMKVIVVDSSLQFGDVGVLLNLPPGRNITDLAETINDLDPDSVDTITLAHASGIKAILAPPRPEMADLLQPDHLKKILEQLRSDYDVVVVDTATVVNDMVLMALDLADRIVLVATPDIPAIKNARLFFEITDALNYQPNKIMLVINKIDRRTGITAQMIEDNIKHQVVAQIPLDEVVVLNSINRGVPFMADARTKPVAQAVSQLADRILTELQRSTAEVSGAGSPADDAARKKTGLFFRSA